MSSPGPDRRRAVPPVGVWSEHQILLGDVKRSGWKRGSLGFFFVGLTLVLAACGKPFRVPEHVRPISGSLSGRTTVGGLTIEAAALTNEDELMELFEANMILARILVVKMTLRNQGQEPVRIHDLELDLRDARHREFESLTPKEVVKKLYNYYEIGTYAIYFRKELEADFEQQRLPLENDLPPGQERRGFLFFQIPEGVDRFSPLGDLTLRLKRLRLAQSGEDAVAELPLRR